MTVKELKELLSKLNDSDVVILQKDSEGSGFSPLDGIWEGKYVAKTTWYGEAYLRELTPELIKQGYSEEDVSKEGANAVILVPVN